MNRGPVSSQILVRRVPVQGLMPEVASASKYIQYCVQGMEGSFEKGGNRIKSRRFWTFKKERPIFT